MDMHPIHRGGAKGYCPTPIRKSIQDRESGLPRISILRGWVNKSIKKGRSSYQPGPSPLAPVAYLARTFQLRLAGVGSVLPAASVAFTSKVWVPLASLPYVLLVAVPLASQLPPSNLVWKVAFEGSVEEKVNVASLLFTVKRGPEVMVVSGGVVSVGVAVVVKVQTVSAASGLPAASLTPFAPPLTVAVYVTPASRSVFGLSVALLVA